MSTETIAALGATFGLFALTAVITSFLYLRSKLEDIHVLVNRRLEVALQEIRDLKAERDQQLKRR